MTKDSIFCLGVIPARGGSKGVPRKNIRDFAGTNLVGLAIRAASESKYLSETIVNTDDEEIAQVARKEGGKVPFMRPERLGIEGISVKDVIHWTALRYEQYMNIRPDVIVTLQPTSPFRTSDHIDNAIELLLSNPDAEGVIGLTEVEHTPYKMRIISDRYTEPLFPKAVVTERQDAPPVYRLNGIVVVSRWKTVVEKKSLWGEKSLPYLLPEEYAFNIDSPLEFRLAEWLFRQKSKAI